MANVNETKDASKIGTNIQFKRKISDAALSDIELAPGEPLFIPALNQLRIGKKATDGTASDADSTILGPASLDANSTDDGAELVFTNSDQTTNTINFKGENGVSVAFDGGSNITIDSNYALSTSEPQTPDNTVTLNLLGSYGNDSSVTFVGSPNLSITKDGDNIKLTGTSKVHIVEAAIDPDKEPHEVLPDTAAPNDICVVKRYITTSPEKLSYTAYVYNATNSGWEAMDGNYSADNVYFSGDITITEDFGKYKKENKQLCPNFESTGNYTLPAGGKSLSNLISDVFSSETQGWTKIPEFTFTVSNNSSGEVGTAYTLPTATFTVTDVGEYQYGPDTGITYTVKVTANEATDTKSGLTNVDGNNTVSVQYRLPSGSTNKYIDSPITHTMSYEYSHTAGATPNTNVTPKTITTTPIAAKENQTGSLSTTFTGYRKSFYVLDKKATDISQTSKIVGSVWSASKPTSISVPAQSTSLLICVPGANIRSVTATDDLAMNSPVTLTAKGNKTLAYNSNGTQTDTYTYSVFEVIWDEPLATAKKLKLTW